MPDVEPPSATHRLADHVLGDQGPLSAFVTTRRDNGISWRIVARDLYETTAGEIDVTHETLRSWFPDDTDAYEPQGAA